MTAIQAVILGLVQGLTEFLPVSSSGHLVVFQQFLEVSTPPLFFDTLVHVGTLTAVAIYFRNQLFNLFTKHLSQLIIGTIPAVIVGLFVYSSAKDIFENLYLTSFAFLITSFVLFLGSRIKNNQQSLASLSNSQAFIIGLFQAAAILPGLSRSGSTISAGLLVGLSNTSAFTFSFILSIPAILGALILNLKDISSVDPGLYLPSFIGFLVALVVGLASLNLLDLILRKKNLLPFAYYTFALGSLLLGLIS